MILANVIISQTLCITNILHDKYVGIRKLFAVCVPGAARSSSLTGMFMDGLIRTHTDLVDTLVVWEADGLRTFCENAAWMCNGLGH